MAEEEEALRDHLRLVERVRVNGVRQSAKLRVREEQHGERHEIDHVTPSPSEHDRRGEEDEKRAVGRPVEPEAPGAERSAGDDRRDDRELAGGRDVWARRAPVALALALGGALLLRVPFLELPLTADEGGYAEIARLWQDGQSLYGELFVDRPQGLLLVYRVLLDLGADSTLALRAAAAGVGVATVLAVAALVTRVGGRINGIAAALLLGTAGASPFVESFTLRASCSRRS